MRLPAFVDAGQEIVLRNVLLHPVDFAFGSVDKDIVVKQRVAGLYKRSILFLYFYIGGGKILEKRFACPHAPVEFDFQPGGLTTVTGR